MRVTTAVATWEGGNGGRDIDALLALCSHVARRLSKERLLVPGSLEIAGCARFELFILHAELGGARVEVVVEVK